MSYVKKKMNYNSRKKFNMNKKTGVGLSAMVIAIIAVTVSTQFYSVESDIDPSTDNTQVADVPSPAQMPLDNIGNKTNSFSEAKRETGLSNAKEPSYVPQGVVLASIRTIQDPTGNEIVLVYLPNGVSITQTTIKQAIADGLAITIKKENSAGFDWNEYVRQQVAEKPTIHSSFQVDGTEVLLVKKVLESEYPFAAKTIKSDLRIEIASEKFDTAELSEVIRSMMTP